MIHRDIKPDNILISHNNVIKLADFGVCQHIDFFSMDDKVGGNDGTPLYHPPEMFDQTVFVYCGTKIDVWAAGVVLYQMLTGKTPFFSKNRGDDDEIEEILHKNINYPDSIKVDILLVDMLNSELTS